MKTINSVHSLIRSGRITQGTGGLATCLRYFSRWHYLYNIQGNLPPGKSLLEFGCGVGDVFLPSRFQTTGLDIDFNSAHSLRQIYHTAINGDVTQLPFKANSYDAVASSFVLEHLPLSAAKAALQEIHRVLRSNGVLICLCDLDCNHPMLATLRKWFPEGYCEAFLEVPGHVGLRREDMWAALLADAGFEVIRWQLMSRFPILDHAPWCYLASCNRLPEFIRRIGRFARWINRLGRAGDIWGLSVMALDDLCRPFLPRTWAYRLLFLARKRD
jgi:SAM-dependent methyltransferase